MRENKIEIVGISSYLPEVRISNEKLVEEFGTWTPEKIYHKTGISERRIAKKELVSEMAFQASENLFREYGIPREEVDLLILCTETPDYLMPATAC
nr:3-oxoacyl-ACP synthase [Synergistales bacterium]